MIIQYITEVWLYYNKKILKKKKKKKTNHSLLKRLIKFDIVYVWIALKRKKKKLHLTFMGPISMEKRKFIFKIGFHDTIHTFKNYFAIVFSVFRNKRYPNRPITF